MKKAAAVNPSCKRPRTSAIAARILDIVDDRAVGDNVNSSNKQSLKDTRTEGDVKPRSPKPKGKLVTPVARPSVVAKVPTSQATNKGTKSPSIKVQAPSIKVQAPSIKVQAPSITVRAPISVTQISDASVDTLGHQTRAIITKGTASWAKDKREVSPDKEAWRDKKKRRVVAEGEGEGGGGGGEEDDPPVIDADAPIALFSSTSKKYIPGSIIGGNKKKDSVQKTKDTPSSPLSKSGHSVQLSDTKQTIKEAKERKGTKEVKEDKETKEDKEGRATAVKKEATRNASTTRQKPPTGSRHTNAAAVHSRFFTAAQRLGAPKAAPSLKQSLSSTTPILTPTKPLIPLTKSLLPLTKSLLPLTKSSPPTTKPTLPPATPLSSSEKLLNRKKGVFSGADEIEEAEGQPPSHAIRTKTGVAEKKQDGVQKTCVDLTFDDDNEIEEVKEEKVSSEGGQVQRKEYLTVDESKKKMRARTTPKDPLEILREWQTPPKKSLPTTAVEKKKDSNWKFQRRVLELASTLPGNAVGASRCIEHGDNGSDTVEREKDEKDASAKCLSTKNRKRPLPQEEEKPLYRDEEEEEKEGERPSYRTTSQKEVYKKARTSVQAPTFPIAPSARAVSRDDHEHGDAETRPFIATQVSYDDKKGWIAVTESPLGHARKRIFSEECADDYVLSVLELTAARKKKGVKM